MGKKDHITVEPAEKGTVILVLSQELQERFKNEVNESARERIASLVEWREQSLRAASLR